MVYGEKKITNINQFVTKPYSRNRNVERPFAKKKGKKKAKKRQKKNDDGVI